MSEGGYGGGRDEEYRSECSFGGSEGPGGFGRARGRARGGGRGGADLPYLGRGRAARGRSSSYPSLPRGPEGPMGYGSEQNYQEETVSDRGYSDDGRGGGGEGGRRDERSPSPLQTGGGGGGGGRGGRRDSVGSQESRGSRGSRGGRGGRGDERGRGRGGGGRGRRERPGVNEEMDYVITRPQQVAETTKRGVKGQIIPLLANFFVLKTRTDWCLNLYRVDFTPDEEKTYVKKQLLRRHEATIGSYIFDGASLYTARQLYPDPMVLYTEREGETEKMEISLRLVKQLVPGDPQFLQFFNIIVRKCLGGLQLEELGRNFYDRHQQITMPDLRLCIWPGYKTSIRNHENDLMMNVEIIHKVIREENALQVITGLRGSRDPKRAITEELVGTIVMTHYNRKTYRIDDIDWDNTPQSTFQLRSGEEISFEDYYAKAHHCQITDRCQPLLVSRPKKKDFHRGQTGPILLIPEFCQMTGLTDSMRANRNMMKALADHLHANPKKKIQEVRGFMERLTSKKELTDELTSWGLGFEREVVKVDNARLLPTEQVFFYGDRDAATGKINPQRFTPQMADWTNAFRIHRLYSSPSLDNWVIIVPQRDCSGIDNLVNTFDRVSRPLGFRIGRPEVLRIGNSYVQTYVEEIDRAMSRYGRQGDNSLQMIFIVLPNNKIETYSAVKRKCVCEYGISSQCFVARNVQSRGLMSIATKCVIQMSAKLGGEPWIMQNPMQKVMVAGFDVYHCGKRKGASVGALVATTSGTLGRYCGFVGKHACKEELSSNLCVDMAKALSVYGNQNQFLPNRIILYRDGVGDGHLTYVFNNEVEQIWNAITSVYQQADMPLPSFQFIVISKKINSRVVTMDYNNPSPGTVVDDVITLPERWDFYLISQTARQGTVSPTSYNVIYEVNQQGHAVLTPCKIQQFTYKMCHLYYNWSGTVAVPAPNQYAHKLATLQGMALKDSPPDEVLSDRLYYL